MIWSKMAKHSRICSIPSPVCSVVAAISRSCISWSVDTDLMVLSNYCQKIKLHEFPWPFKTHSLLEGEVHLIKLRKLQLKQKRIGQRSTTIINKHNWVKWVNQQWLVGIGGTGLVLAGIGRSLGAGIPIRFSVRWAIGQSLRRESFNA